MQRVPAFWKVLKHDNAAFLFASFPSVFVAMALFIRITGEVPPTRHHGAVQADPRAAGALLGFALILMIVLWIPAAFRVFSIQRLFESGTEVLATVRKVSMFKGYSRIDLDYVYRGVVRSVRSTIRRSARARALGPGSSIRVIVDSSRPSRLVLAELYD